ncbi:hypothetical protein EHEL_091080 [Encephalitozoon hellem ATCC 50504]|uniref:Uncharacterized protein n=1 Tax=Encephalitozoon hellem TaxID=27973 RepID=A0A9Q9F8T5_ENCHE|nr:uncharacterized protein EHEL_091080 [Encephalitozoon hellem ATCC 50504]AFM99003.1 hypothetical protein EHEL_091080 [Encephalitozoon hellem ATCC 50504]UTX44019.1 hypothetical protein GPU96_09g17990 [Encephalitozoon hellem]WEL39504.1 hypothetical protein PFJ87_09g01320 [Encephalitozoon hellem]|eukprot:XP_003887984.1 hypothetical protein EHEL_091080 [Encephalitozoon hellem ATCC 50504]
MFDSEYFKNLLNETTALITNKAEEGNDGEEMEARIESNVTTLKYLAKEITDEELRKKTLKRIDMLCFEPEEFEMSEVRNRMPEIRKSSEFSDRIERDILKYTKRLHGKVKEFMESVDVDSKVLGEVTDKMSRNLMGTSETLRSLKSKGQNIPILGILTSVMVTFVAMYFVIRFL